VLWLTVAVYMITYMDRTAIASAIPFIQKEFGISTVTVGWILSSFSCGHALFQVPGGWLGDRLGPRRALTAIVCWWSFFTAMTAMSWNAVSMVLTRFLFGVGEAGAFPIATRSLSRWILPSERGYAQGVTHAGSRLGASLTPPLVVALTVAYGWRSPFFVFDAIGIAWAVVWFFYYRDTPSEHSSVNQAELSIIHDAIGKRSGTTRSVPWRAILACRTLWIMSAMYFCYGYCINVYLAWFPSYLSDHRGFSMKQMGLYASLPLLCGTVGDLCGGWFSDLWFKNTGNLRTARRAVGSAGFLIAATGIIPSALTDNPYMSVLFSCVAVFGLELTVGVSWALPLDIGAEYAGSVSAVMNTCGNTGAAVSPVVMGYMAHSYGWNQPFLLAASLCVVAAVLYMRIDATRHVAFAELS